MKRRLTILGSTGSVGQQALDVVRAHRDRFEVVGLELDDDVDRLGNCITDGIQAIGGVKRTTTCLAIRLG